MGVGALLVMLCIIRAQFREPVERMPAGEQFVECDRRKRRCPSAFEPAIELFRRHVRQRSDQRPCGVMPSRGRLGTRRDAEIHDLHRAVAQQHDVGRLDVAMDDALAWAWCKPAAACIMTSNFFRSRSAWPGWR